MRTIYRRTHVLRAGLLALALLALPLALPGKAHAMPMPFPISNFGQLIDSVNHTQDTNAFLQSLTPPNPIIPPNPITPPNPIDVATFLHGDNAEALSNALSRNAVDIPQMQTLLGQLTVAPLGGPCDLCGQPMPLADYLASQGLSLNQIIAVGTPPSPVDQPLEIVFQPATTG